MTAPAIAAALEGARYQYRFFWRMALPMLYLKPPLIEKVVMEHRGVTAVDDVVVYYTTPGVADAERLVRIDYHQIKFHVAQGQCIEAANLIDPAWTGTTQSLLWRFARSWKELRQHERELRLSLVTNWPWCPDDPLAPLIRDSGTLEEAFFTNGPTSKVGKLRTAWRRHLSLLADAEFNDFIRQLRLCVRAVSQRDAEEWLADRCQLAGLRRPSAAEHHSAYDDLAGRLLADGRREFNPADLAALVQQENLAIEPAQPFLSTCSVRSFRRFADAPVTDAKVVIDLTDLFDGRAPVDGAVWTEAIPARLAGALAAIDDLPRPVQLALDSHLAIGWYVGTLLDSKAGIPVLLRQKGYGGVELWDTSTPQPDLAQAWQIDVETIGDGTEVALALSVTHDVAAEVRTALPPSVGTFVHAHLPTLGGQAVRGGGHAAALADDLARALRDIGRARGAVRTHIFGACPVSFAFVLGQRSAAIGPVTMYEYDFGATRTYRAALAT